MRVVAGSARGRRLVAPQGRDTRPTADRVREAIFNALHSRGLIEGATMCDLFAGSGALGIEALSRGAARVTFVDRAGPALACLRTNLAVTQLAGRADIVGRDVAVFVAGEPGPFDVALVDPPYAFDGWGTLLDALHRMPVEVVVAESNRALAAPPGWSVSRSARYGSTVVTLFARVDPSSSDPLSEEQARTGEE